MTVRVPSLIDSGGRCGKYGKPEPPSGSTFSQARPKSETFTIGGAKARKDDDSTWSADVAVPPSGDAVIVGVRVEGTNGTVGSEYFLVVRAKDGEAPGFERSTGAVDAVVPFEWTDRGREQVRCT